MTNLTWDAFLFEPAIRSTIGVDRFLNMHRIFNDTAKKIGSYPPCNIRKLDGQNVYKIELAVAGYTLADLEIELTDNVLTISSPGVNPGNDLLSQGFAYRAFTKKFSLMDSVVVKNAELVNGVLSIYLEDQVPTPKTMKINIEAPKATTHPQLLNEASDI